MDKHCIIHKQRVAASTASSGAYLAFGRDFFGGGTPSCIASPLEEEISIGILSPTNAAASANCLSSSERSSLAITRVSAAFSIVKLVLCRFNFFELLRLRF